MGTDGTSLCAYAQWGGNSVVSLDLEVDLDGPMLQFSHMGVEPKIGVFPPKSSILIGFCIINHPFWGYHDFGKHPYPY